MLETWSGGCSAGRQTDMEPGRRARRGGRALLWLQRIAVLSLSLLHKHNEWMAAPVPLAYTARNLPTAIHGLRETRNSPPWASLGTKVLYELNW